MYGLSLRSLLVSALALAVFLPGATFAQEEGPEFLTIDLAPGDENAEVTLLQEWLSTDAELYPEQVVNGTYGPATEAAVKRYQEQQGIILTNADGDTTYGSVGAVTRADMNARFSSKKGGVAVVESEYGEAARWNGEAFVALQAQDYSLEGPIVKRLDVWVKPAALTDYETSLFSTGNGYAIGMEGYGKINARTPEGKAVTVTKPIQAGEWQHVSVRFSATEAVILHNDEILGTFPLQHQRPWTAFDAFFDRITSTFYGAFIPNFERPVVEQAATDSVAPEVKSDGLFGKIASFFRGVFGIAAPTAETPVAITPTPAASEEVAPSEPITPAAPPAPEPDIFAPPPVVTLPPKPAVFTPATTTVVKAVATSTAMLAVGTTTATSTTATSTEEKSDTDRTSSSSSSLSNGSIPVITLKGSAEVILEGDDVYSDPGASATDKEDGSLTKKIKVGGDEINYFKVGDYEITYNVTDSDGNKAKEVVRIVRVTEPAEIPESQQQPRYSLAAAGENVTYTVSGAATADPKFISVQISPLHVYVGQTQTFTVKVSSATGVTSVTSETELDTSTLELPLELKSSSGGVDTYEASWVVYDTHVRTYHTTFTAESGAGNENEVTMAWSDPCSGVTQNSNSSLSGNCSVSEVSGLDGGSLTVPAGVTLTLNAGATWAWNPGTTITVDGAIVKASGAQLRKGYLYYSGSSNATANTSSLIFDTASSLSGHVRVNQYSQASYYAEGYYYAQGYYYSQGYYQSFYYAEFKYCFDPSTLVLMADGSQKPIKDVKLGDLVMGQDRSGQNRINVVTNLYVHGPEEHDAVPYNLLRINGHLLVTPEHAMYTQRGWIAAGSLKIGDVFTGSDGSDVAVTSIEEGYEAPTVYNLEVYPTHNYFAGGILVHNGKIEGSQCDLC